MNKLIVIFVVLHTVNAIPASSIEQQWESFKEKSLKKFQNELEEKLRKSEFSKHADEIMKHNQLFEKGLASYKMNFNKFSDLSHKNFVMHMHMNTHILIRHKKKNTTDEKPIYFKGKPNFVLPDSIDWRKRGAVTPIRSQDQCNSCWAFSSVGAIEGQHFRKTGQLVQLSEQNLIDCMNRTELDSCVGHTIQDAFKYVIRNGGIDTERSYPFEAVSGHCKYRSQNSGAKIHGYSKIPSGDEKLLQEALATIGPISVCIDATHESFQHYSSGIYYEKECSSNPDDLSHALLLVGYGRDDRGREYYIAKNSWGEDWGDSGYVYIARNRKNHCGVATDATFPMV